MLRLKDIKDFKEYLRSGTWEEHFDYRTSEGQGEMLDLIEELFELCEIADDILTKKLYKNMSGEGAHEPPKASRL